MQSASNSTTNSSTQDQLALAIARKMRVENLQKVLQIIDDELIHFVPITLLDTTDISEQTESIEALLPSLQTARSAIPSLQTRLNTLFKGLGFPISELEATFSELKQTIDNILLLISFYKLHNPVLLANFNLPQTRGEVYDLLKRQVEKLEAMRQKLFQIEKQFINSEIENLTLFADTKKHKLDANQTKDDERPLKRSRITSTDKGSRNPEENDAIAAPLDIEQSRAILRDMAINAHPILDNIKTCSDFISYNFKNYGPKLRYLLSKIPNRPATYLTEEQLLPWLLNQANETVKREYSALLPQLNENYLKGIELPGMFARCVTFMINNLHSLREYLISPIELSEKLLNDEMKASTIRIIQQLDHQLTTLIAELKSISTAWSHDLVNLTDTNQLSLKKFLEELITDQYDLKITESLKRIIREINFLTIGRCYGLLRAEVSAKFACLSTYEAPKAIEALPAYTNELYIADVGVTIEALRLFTTCKSIRALDLSGIHFIASAVSAIPETSPIASGITIELLEVFFTDLGRRSLYELSIDAYCLDAIDPSLFNSLQVLRITGCLEDRHLLVLANFPSLRELSIDLRGANLNALRDLQTLATNKDLQFLQVELDEHVEFLVELAMNTTLQMLHISFDRAAYSRFSNETKDAIENALCGIAAIPSLKWLKLVNVCITPKVAEALAANRDLSTLGLSYLNESDVSGALPILAASKTLTSLFVNGPIKDTDVLALLKNRSLRNLRLHNIKNLQWKNFKHLLLRPRLNLILPNLMAQWRDLVDKPENKHRNLRLLMTLLSVASPNEFVKFQVMAGYKVPPPSLTSLCVFAIKQHQRNPAVVPLDTSVLTKECQEMLRYSRF